MTPRGTRRVLYGLDRRLVATGGCGGVLSGVFAAFLGPVSVRLVRDSLVAQ